MGLETFKVPQSTGEPGWIVFTYEKNIPVCLWINSQECKKLPCCIDERLCGDTFLKVEKLSEYDYLVADIWIYNSNCVFVCSTFQQRYKWLAELLSEFFRCIPGKTIRLIHKSTHDFKDQINGYEFWSSDIQGKQGYFVEDDKSRNVTIVRTSIPDSYEVEGTSEYIKILDLTTSLYLRSKGPKFEACCIQNKDSSWTLLENIPDVE
jgi:hypothetical protein